MNQGASAGDATEPIFIVGTQRSGTTLLARLLGEIPGLDIMNEFWSFHDCLIGSANPRAVIARRFSKYDFAPPDGDDPFVHLEAGFAARAQSDGFRRWGLKDPRLTYTLNHFRERYPKAPFLFIVRDPRATCSSMMKQRWNVANSFCGARLWLKEVSLQREFILSHPDHCLQIRYEDLVSSPDSVVPTICDFIREPFDPALLEFHSAPNRNIRVHAGNENILKAINPELSEKWRSELSPTQIRIIEATAETGMREFGYEVSRSDLRPPGATRRMAYGLHQWFCTNYWWQQRNGWKGPWRRLTQLLGR